MRDPWVLPAKPDIPPTAAPPEASYRRPEDNIVLSRPPSIPCTTSHKTCQQLPYNKRHPNIRVPLNARSMGSARQTGHTPHGRTSRSFIQKARGQYCFISLTQDTMHYLTQNTPPNPTIKGTHIRVPFGQDLWVWPDNPAYPPHSRTSATPSPQRMKILTKDLLGRVAHERRGHYCFISLTQNTTRVIYLRLSRPVLPRTR